jgi:NAD+ synthase (glutamine-hydrolysing)
MGVAKRIQAPPVLAVSRRAYGFDQRESQTKVLWTKAYLNLKAQLLEA